MSSQYLESVLAPQLGFFLLVFGEIRLTTVKIHMKNSMDPRNFRRGADVVWSMVKLHVGQTISEKVIGISCVLIERPSVGYKHSSASQVCLGKFDMGHHLLPRKLNLVGYTVWKSLAWNPKMGNVHITLP